jgi:23S rRNA (cytidine1920-2'-O)/16S rRNA (cytidine1409-2'-O)-methyltransferase
VTLKRRLDHLLVHRGLAASREKAQALILAGEVRVEGQPARKPGHSFPESAGIEVTARLPYVSRGGVKLAAALDHWSIDPAGMVCADIGASTGGFTDCLLQRGAARVHTVDVGPSQLAWKIQTDPRVAVHDQTNARTLTPETLGEPVALAVCDASFISATLLLDAMISTLAPGGRLVILVKPQFEVGREQVGKGGIVRDPALREAALHKVIAALAARNFDTSWIESPITGAEGNHEFLVYARPPAR